MKGLLGARATEAAVKALAGGRRVIRLATNGFFLESECRESAVVKEDSLLRSGLVFAGASHQFGQPPWSTDAR